MGLASQPLAGHAVERDPELLGERAQVGVVADDGGDLGAQLGVGVAHEEVGEAMVLARGEHDQALRITLAKDHGLRRPESRLHPHADRVGVTHRALECGAHVEVAVLQVDELMVRDDVHPRAQEHSRDGVHQAGSVDTLDEELFRLVCHGVFLLRFTGARRQIFEEARETRSASATPARFGRFEGVSDAEGGSAAGLKWDGHSVEGDIFTVCRSYA
jgi:hypothetical protein